jgi:hypothetical protein
MKFFTFFLLLLFPFFASAQNNNSPKFGIMLNIGRAFAPFEKRNASIFTASAMLSHKRHLTKFNWSNLRSAENYKVCSILHGVTNHSENVKFYLLGGLGYISGFQLDKVVLRPVPSNSGNIDGFPNFDPFFEILGILSGDTYTIKKIFEFCIPTEFGICVNYDEPVAFNLAIAPTFSKNYTFCSISLGVILKGKGY